MTGPDTKTTILDAAEALFADTGPRRDAFDAFVASKTVSTTEVSA